MPWTESEIERERHEDRLKDKREYATWLAELNDAYEALKQGRAEFEQTRAEAHLALAKLTQARAEAIQERGECIRQAELIACIDLCQRLLRRPFPGQEELQRLPLDELEGIAMALEAELIRSGRCYR
jgi:hypothetical protein